MSSSKLSDPANQAVCLIEQLGKASGFLSKTDGTQVAAACEGVKEMLRRRARGLVYDSIGLPMLSSKSCDGTPLRATYYVSHQVTQTKKARHHGKEGREVLVSNEFVRYKDPAEGYRTAVLLSEPVPLTEGKTTDLVLAAARQNWVTLRGLGAEGCCIEHYVWDRLGIESLERQCRAWHSVQPIPETEQYPLDKQKHMLFVVVTPCALHDGQNAFRWSYLKECQDRSLMRDLYIAVESLRNSSDVLCSHMSSWVCQRLQFVEERGSAWRVQARELWAALDMDVELVDLFVAELELVWDGEHLCVRAGAQVSLTLL